MDTYKIPLVWQMYGHCNIDATSLEEAIEIALDATLRNPLLLTMMFLNWTRVSGAEF